MLHFAVMGKQARHTSTSDGSPADRSERLEMTLGRDGSDIPEVRAAVRTLAEHHGFADRAGDLVLALDELIGNAKEHGAPPVTVRGWYDGRLIVEVSDAGDGFDYSTVRRVHPPPVLGHRGRGIWIVRQVADHMRVAIGDNDTTVRLEMTHEPGIGA